MVLHISNTLANHLTTLATCPVLPYRDRLLLSGSLMTSGRVELRALRSLARLRLALLDPLAPLLLLLLLAKLLRLLLPLPSIS